MTQRLSYLIATMCLAVLLLLPLAALWLLFNPELFTQIAQRNLPFQIIWESVESSQMITAWFVSALYMGVGLTGLFFLRRAFLNFAKGKLFDESTTRDLRRFSIFVFIQGLITPIYYACLSVILSWNHPPGQKMLSVTFGSNELRFIGLALIFWVICDLLLEAEKLKQENQQFI
ncbi:MAG: DUF2975 domain-containing protein [Acidiferrobacterales bacterium]|nr:DUF2975 domain-containing protein [Acidiferrobacterales bacterium]